MLISGALSRFSEEFVALHPTPKPQPHYTLVQTPEPIEPRATPSPLHPPNSSAKRLRDYGRVFGTTRMLSLMRVKFK